MLLFFLKLQLLIVLQKVDQSPNPAKLEQKETNKIPT